MSKLETIYRHLPPVLQNAACYWQGWRIKRRRYNNEFHATLSDYESRRNWSTDELNSYRDKKLSGFVVEAVRHVPFYRARFQEWGVDPAGIHTLSDLERLPILTRQQAQAASSELHAENIPESATIISHTSGTTGTGLRFPMTHSAEHEQWAVWWRYRRAHGIDFKTRCAVFSGRPVVPIDSKKPPFWRYNRAANQVLFSGYHLKEENFACYIAELRRSGASWLHGYPSHITLLADFILSAGDIYADLRRQIVHVTIGAESLLEHQREAINEAFEVTVRQHYGLAEGVANISECPEGHLHVDEDFAAVEFVKRDNDMVHAIIGTNFTNSAFPLLRYDTGDTVALGEPEEFLCGYSGRVVKSIDGRVEDYVLLDDGSRIGRMDHIFKDMTSIREAQIVQRVPGAIEIRVVRSRGYSRAEEQRLLDETHSYCGQDLRIEIKHFDDLPRSRTGKLRFVVSEIESATIRAEA